MLWLSHVSVPMRMSGSCVEMKLPSSAVLFLILWKFILMILRGLWACLSAVVVGGVKYAKDSKLITLARTKILL